MGSNKSPCFSYLPVVRCPVFHRALNGHNIIFFSSCIYPFLVDRRVMKRPDYDIHTFCRWIRSIILSALAVILNSSPLVGLSVQWTHRAIARRPILEPSWRRPPLHKWPSKEGRGLASWTPLPSWGPGLRTLPWSSRTTLPRQEGAKSRSRDEALRPKVWRRKGQPKVF